MNESPKTATIRAKDGATDLKIEITIDFENGHYSRDEREAAIENATSMIMSMVPGMRFVGVSRIRTTR